MGGPQQETGDDNKSKGLISNLMHINEHVILIQHVVKSKYLQQHKFWEMLKRKKEKTNHRTVVEHHTDKLVDYLIFMLTRGTCFMISISFWLIICLIRKECGAIGIGVTRFR